MPPIYQNKRTGERVWIKRHFQESVGTDGKSASCVELSNAETWMTNSFNHDFKPL